MQCLDGEWGRKGGDLILAIVRGGGRRGNTVDCASRASVGTYDAEGVWEGVLEADGTEVALLLGLVLGAGDPVVLGVALVLSLGLGDAVLVRLGEALVEASLVAVGVALEDSSADRDADGVGDTLEDGDSDTEA
jgi:hypothetical protein